MLRKIAALIIAAFCLPACAGRCRDKHGGFFAFDKAYRACKEECHLPEEEGGKKCGCSSSCPCWKHH